MENSGDVPVYIGKIEVGIDGLEDSSAYIFDGVVKPDSTATISASIYIPSISSSEHNLSCRVFDTDNNLLTSSNFTVTPSYNPYMKIPTSARITLATKDEEKMLSVDQDFAMQIIKQNIEKGDVIEVRGYRGRIVTVGLLNTSIETEDGNRIVLPNSVLATEEIKILKNRGETRK